MDKRVLEQEKGYLKQVFEKIDVLKAQNTKKIKNNQENTPTKKLFCRKLL